MLIWKIVSSKYHYKISVESEDAEWLVLIQNPVAVTQCLTDLFLRDEVGSLLFSLFIILLEIADFYPLLTEGFLHEIDADSGFLVFVDDFVDMSKDKSIHLFEILCNDGENGWIGARKGFFRACIWTFFSASLVLLANLWQMAPI